YGLPLLRRFRAGTRRASPVAQHVLVTVPSLPPRRGKQPYRSVFGCSCCLRPSEVGSALGATFSRPQCVLFSIAGTAAAARAVGSFEAAKRYYRALAGLAVRSARALAAHLFWL